MKVTLHHVAIQTADFERAISFYTSILGLKIIKQPFIYKGERKLAWLDAGSVVIELYSIKFGTSPSSYDQQRIGADHLAFEVQNLEGFITYLKNHDIQIIKEPFLPKTEDPHQPRVAFVEGPDGEEIEIRQEITTRLE